MHKNLKLLLAMVLAASNYKIQTNSLLTLQCDMVPILRENFSFTLIHAVSKPVQDKFRVVVMAHGSVLG